MEHIKITYLFIAILTHGVIVSSQNMTQPPDNPGEWNELRNLHKRSLIEMCDTLCEHEQLFSVWASEIVHKLKDNVFESKKIKVIWSRSRLAILCHELNMTFQSKRRSISFCGFILRNTSLLFVPRSLITSLTFFNLLRCGFL